MTSRSLERELAYLLQLNHSSLCLYPSPPPTPSQKQRSQPLSQQSNQYFHVFSSFNFFFVLDTTWPLREVGWRRGRCLSPCPGHPHHCCVAWWLRYQLQKVQESTKDPNEILFTTYLNNYFYSNMIPFSFFVDSF